MPCSRRKSARPKKKRGVFCVEEVRRGGVPERLILNLAVAVGAFVACCSVGERRVWKRLRDVATVPPRPWPMIP